MTRAALAAPGSWRPTLDRWGTFHACAAALPRGALCLVDERVATLHPPVVPALTRRASNAVLLLRAGERAKSLAALGRVSERAARQSRNAPLVVVGGGTLGDLGTVVAHLARRGVPLVLVPTTLLAAVDSSVGGKGALHATSGGRLVKNAWGCFHYADAAWLCPELWTTLDARHLRQGAVEAVKMAACLDAGAFARWALAVPALEQMVRDARALKARVCHSDPYEITGARRVLNFGHTFGHALESLTGFRLAHGDAVAVGMLCALDVGRAAGVTGERLAAELERILREHLRAPGRRRLTGILRRCSDDDVAALLASDKKGADAGGLNMVLLERAGRAGTHRIAARAWRRLARAWREGVTP
ncbi:MAG: 3-dehydroquinate synthase [Deltaproteobacteria bacterium]|nr:3-dehydroquinate synthase [Deltaproteobacteria bacterium]